MNDKFNNGSDKQRDTKPDFKVEKVILTYLLISLMVSICISLFMSFSEKSDSGISFIFYLLYSFPVIFTLGSLSSLLIEYKLGKRMLILRNSMLEYSYKLFLYIFAGFIAMNLFWIVLTLSIPRFISFKEFFLLYSLGIFGALLYYHILLLFKVIESFISKNRLC